MLLASAKVPLVGHNCFMDLLKLHHQFVDWLPFEYDKFKSSLHGLFPAVYDTKRLAYEIRQQLIRMEHFEFSGNLSEQSFRLFQF